MQKDPATRLDDERLIALSVSPCDDDHRNLRRHFKSSGWILYTANSLESALLTLASERRIGVVVCERDLAPHSWTNVLDHLALLDHAPRLIVTSVHADEYLWAEALNLGAHDVLAKPFDPQELIRALTLAWLFWVGHREVGRQTKVMTAGSSFAV